MIVGSRRMPAAPRLSYALGLVRQLFDARSRLAAELASISNVFRFEGTAMTGVTFTLPDDLARQAESARLLSSRRCCAMRSGSDASKSRSHRSNACTPSSLR